MPSPPSAAGLAVAEAAGSPFTASKKAGSLTSDPWTLDLPIEEALLTRLANENPNLGAVAADVVFQGVVTGADFVFRLLDDGVDAKNPALRRVMRRDTHVEGLVEAELLRPVYGGRGDIRQFSVNEATEALLLPYERPRTGAAFELISGSKLEHRYPHAWAWLKQHEDQLKRRAGTWTEHNWWSYSRRQNLELFEEPKVLVPYMIDQLCAHYDTSGHFFVNVSTGGYGIPAANLADPGYIAALLNSRVLSWVLRRKSRAFRGGWFAARKGNLVQLPIADAGPADRDEIARLYHLCLSTAAAVENARSDRDRETCERTHAAAADAFHKRIDEVYGITPTESALIRSGLEPDS